MSGVYADPVRDLATVMPALREGAATPALGRQVIVSAPIGAPLLVDGVTYKHALFVAPCNGWYIKEAWLSAAVTLAGGTNTLAVDNYDASANAARNVLSTTNVSPAVTSKEGSKLTLSATQTNLMMDEGDVLNVTLVCGTMTTDGEGYVLTAVLIGPEIV